MMRCALLIAAMLAGVTPASAYTANTVPQNAVDGLALWALAPQLCHVPEATAKKIWLKGMMDTTKKHHVPMDVLIDLVYKSRLYFLSGFVDHPEGITSLCRTANSTPKT